MPILDDILEHKVLGREFKRGLQEGRQEGLQEGARTEVLAVLRRLLEKRFGAMPAWAEDRLASLTVSQLEELSVAVLEAPSLEELLK